MATWFPLESNPEVMNKYIKSLGAVDINMEFTDVFGTSPELLEMVPQPVKAVLFVYPISLATEKYCADRTEAQQAEVEAFMKDNKVFFAKQYVPNACGTIGILHALLNNAVDLGTLAENSPLSLLASGSESKTSESIGEEVKSMKVLSEAHAVAALEGATTNLSVDTPINLHFVCFVRIGGRCVELDGRQKAPILHGCCTDGPTLLTAAIGAIEERMAMDPDSMEYSITALVGAGARVQNQFLRHKKMVWTIASRLYRYPNGSVDEVMQMVQRVGRRRKQKLRWCMDTENMFAVEVFDDVTQRWLVPITGFSPDIEIKEEAIEKQVETLLASKPLRQQQLRPHSRSLQPTVIDLAKPFNVVEVAKEQIRARFPNLQLQLVHTSGQDIQSRQTHTISVGLVENGGSLSSDEQTALKKFKAEAIGPGFLRTAKRALEEAFEKCGLTFCSTVQERSKSVLSSYAELLQANSQDLSVSVVHKTENAVVQVRIDNKLCSSFTCKGSATLASILEALKEAAEREFPAEAQQLLALVEAHPLILVLPKDNIRVKQILRVLLHYYYGLTEEDVFFDTNHRVQGVFSTTIKAALPLVKPSVHGERESVSLASASGMSKSAAEQLAAVLALQAHFSKEYIEQLSYHSELTDILNSTKASPHLDYPPPANKGLKNLLDWALTQRDVEVKLTSFFLQAHKKYETFGVQPTAPIWSTTVEIRAGETTNKLVVYDQKKNRCENKAIAITLFSYFADLCPEGITYAKAKGLLTDGGTTPTCSALVPLESYDAATVEDKLLASLKVVPWQTVLYPSEEGLCLLQRLRTAAQTTKDQQQQQQQQQQQGFHFEERILYDAEKEVFVASLVMLKEGREEVVSSFAHRNELRCLLSLYTSFAKEHAETAKALTFDVPYHLPIQTPLETLAILAHRLYGLQVAVRLTTANSFYSVELWGVSKDGDAGAKRWILGRAKGSSLQNAVRLCCIDCFEVHVRHLHPPFSGSLSNAAEITLTIGEQSVLARLMRHVKEEIEQATTGNNLSLVIRLSENRGASIPFTVVMVVVSDARTIPLEKCSGSTLLSLLQELQKSIAVETGELAGKGLASAAVPPPASRSSLVERLKERCESLCGLPLTVESLLYDKKWVSRLSLQLNETHSYALCVSQSAKKKESIENACSTVLFTCFDEPEPNLLSSEASVDECNYVFSHTESTDQRDTL